MGGSHKRAYGKGGTASSRAVLSDLFLDENEIEEQMASMALGEAVSPLSSKEDEKPVSAASAAPAAPAPSAATVARKGKGAESDPGVESSAVTFTLPLRAEGHKLKGLRDFPAWAKRVAEAFRVVKVGEGSYGEVFKLESRTLQSQVVGRDSILKLIPLRSKSSQSNSHMSLNALIHEVQMLKLMDPIPGFTRFRDLTVLQGPYPPSFTNAFNEYKAVEENDSKSDLPSRYADKQLWVLIEMDDGGKDLETLTAPSMYQIYDIFWLICCSLSYAEEQVEFEHRDLHIGNICIRPSHSNNSLDISPDKNRTMTASDFQKSHFGHSGLRTTIIDYTLSRGTSRPSPTSEPTVTYDDFRTAPGIFKGAGSTPEEARQRITYRSMREHALLTAHRSTTENRSRENRKLNAWARFLPWTNVLWLDYLLFVFLYRCQEAGKRVLEGSSEASAEVQEELRVRLVRVWDLVRGKGEWLGKRSVPGSAREVVEVARAEDLLGEEDLLAIREVLGREE